MKLANKRRKNFNIYIVFKKKEKRKIPRDIIISHLSHLIYSSWAIERVRLKLVILGHLLPFPG